MSRNSNTPTVPTASSALNNFKMEVANELGITNYDQIDKGQLSSSAERLCGWQYDPQDGGFRRTGFGPGPDRFREQRFSDPSSAGLT